MAKRSIPRILATLIAAPIAAAPAYAITHPTEYKTNLDNYRTCTDPLLDTCDYPDVLSPSIYYLPSNTTRPGSTRTTARFSFASTPAASRPTTASATRAGRAVPVSRLALAARDSRE